MKKNSDYETIRSKKGIFKRVWERLNSDERDEFVGGLFLIGILLFITGGLFGLLFGFGIGDESGANIQAKQSCTNMCSFHNYQIGQMIKNDCVCLHPKYGPETIYEVENFK